VPEGANSCPRCGASLASIVLSKERRGLTKTLIGKAIELRQSIPWANPSQIVLLDDPRRPGKKKVRSGARNVFVLMLLGAVATGAFYVWRNPAAEPKHIDVYQVTMAEPETKPLQPPKPAAPAPAPAPTPKPAEPAPVAKAAPPSPPPAPASAPALATEPPGKAPPGTLVVLAMYKGKPIKDASVHINGVTLGVTPVKAAVVPGRYTVKVDHAGFKSEKRPDVDVRSGKTQAITVELKK
jgi:hypothetical protein